MPRPRNTRWRDKRLLESWVCRCEEAARLSPYTFQGCMMRCIRMGLLRSLHWTAKSVS